MSGQGNIHFFANWAKERLEAGSQSWSAFTAALTETRAVFDRANQAAWEAPKRRQRPNYGETAVWRSFISSTLRCDNHVLILRKVHRAGSL